MNWKLRSGTALCVLALPAAAFGQTEPALEALLEALEVAVYDGKDVFQPAMAIARLDDPESIPTLIGLIDADNSNATVYGIGWFALNPLTGVRYDASHHGPWWGTLEVWDDCRSGDIAIGAGGRAKWPSVVMFWQRVSRQLDALPVWCNRQAVEGMIAAKVPRLSLDEAMSRSGA